MKSDEAFAALLAERARVRAQLDRPAHKKPEKLAALKARLDELQLAIDAALRDAARKDAP